MGGPWPGQSCQVEGWGKTANIERNLLTLLQRGYFKVVMKSQQRRGREQKYEIKKSLIICIILYEMVYFLFEQFIILLNHIRSKVI